MIFRYSPMKSAQALSDLLHSVSYRHLFDLSGRELSQGGNFRRPDSARLTALDEGLDLWT